MQVSLFVEGLKMRPSAERVLLALSALDGQPAYYPRGNTTEELAAYCGLSAHVVRARLCDLRRLGLVQSDRFGRNIRYTHCLTDEGMRRVATALTHSREPAPF